MLTDSVYKLYDVSKLGYRIGMDLNKVTFPTFVLEPRSMLERITDFMSHPELVFGCVSLCFLICVENSAALNSADQEEQPEERFIRVLMYYLSGWHVKPKGVKKPFVLIGLTPLGRGVNNSRQI